MPDNNGEGIGVHSEALSRRFLAQDEKISDLEKAVNTMSLTLARLDDEFFNHDGGDGLKTIVLKRFAADDQRHASEKEFRELRDKEAKDRIEATQAKIKADLDAHDRERRESDMIFKRWLSVAAFAISLLLLVIAWREFERKTAFSEPPPVVQSTHPQQNSLDPSIESKP